MDMPIRYSVIDSHKNMSSRRRDSLVSFFCEVKGISGEDAVRQVEFCDWYESEYAVKWFEVVAADGTDVAGYLRCFRNPDDIRQWYIGDVHVRNRYRRRGVATRMYMKVFTELERYEAAENVVAAVRKDNRNSIELHKKMGFEDTGEPCRFASFFIDENETKYQKWLYRYLPVPENIGIDKLMELFLPIWTQNPDSSNSDGKAKDEALKKAKRELRKLLERMKRNEVEVETIWCGNRLTGLKYDDRIFQTI